MRETTLLRHDKLIRENETRIIDALHRESNASRVARELKLPVAVIRYVKAQLPASKMRGKHRGRATVYDESMVIAALRRVADQVEEPFLTERAYGRNRRATEPSLARVGQLYGRWNSALQTAGLPSRPSAGSRTAFTTDDCLAALASCAEAIHKSPTYDEYERWSRTRADAPSGQTIRNRLGRWLEALDAAGL